MPDINFDKRKVSPLNIDFIGVTTCIDTELARTLLRYREWKFISAADRHHVSQSTVSTRIHTFDTNWAADFLSAGRLAQRQRLPVDNFNGALATRVRTIEQAGHDIGIPEGVSSTLVVAGRIGLREEFPLKSLQLICEARPEISVPAESGRSALIRAVHSPETVRFETRAIVRRRTRHGCDGSKGDSGAVTRLCVWIGDSSSYEARHRARNHARVRKAERNKEKVSEAIEKCALLGAMQSVTNGSLGPRAPPSMWTMEPA